MKIEQRYTDGSYLAENPDWDREDAAWKADQVGRILSDNGVRPASMCEVGCGSGDILRHLRRQFPEARLVGYDVSPQLSRFWKEAGIKPRSDMKDVSFFLGDFHELNTGHYDALLMLDVFRARARSLHVP
jgi:ubiquinone/menaquinone biosynthesis C-methylase UbiE